MGVLDRAVIRGANVQGKFLIGGPGRPGYFRVWWFGACGAVDRVDQAVAAKPGAGGDGSRNLAKTQAKITV